MSKLTRDDLIARYEMFEYFALADQRTYYEKTLQKYRTSARQVNRFRAGFAFLTGFTSALAGLLVQVYFVDNGSCSGLDSSSCGNLQLLVYALIISSVVMPVLGGVFNTLADLYQWDRMITIYEAALENLTVADALSPLDEMPEDHIYQASMMAYAEGTLSVMSDETAQWGQAIRTPESLENFVERAKEKVNQLQSGKKLE